MLSILSTLVPVFGIILFGIVVERMGFLPIETSGCLNQFVYWIGLPMMLFNQLARMEAGQMSGAMVGGILLGYGITYIRGLLEPAAEALGGKLGVRPAVEFPERGVHGLADRGAPAAGQFRGRHRRQPLRCDDLREPAFHGRQAGSRET